MHDPTKVLFGTTSSSIREVDSRNGTIEAGLRICLKSDDTISVAVADGAMIGVSLGRDLSNTPRTAILRRGLGVPVQLADGFTPVEGAQVNFSDTTGKACAAGAGATAVNATYASGVKTGLKEDLTTCNCAEIDMPGGL